MLKLCWAHYSEDAQFVSPVARNLIDRSILQNKKELEEYWRTALARISSLEFKLDHAAWDETRRELNVVYEARRWGTSTANGMPSKRLAFCRATQDRDDEGCLRLEPLCFRPARRGLERDAVLNAWFRVGAREP